MISTVEDRTYFEHDVWKQLARLLKEFGQPPLIRELECERMVDEREVLVKIDKTREPSSHSRRQNERKLAIYFVARRNFVCEASPGCDTLISAGINKSAPCSCHQPEN